MTKHVMACIDGSPFSTAVCDWAAYASQQLNTPLTLLHVLERSTNHSESDLSGHIGLGSRENLLEELVKLDAQKSKLNMEQGKLILKALKKHLEDKGIKNLSTRQRHGNLVENLMELEDEIRLLVIGHFGTHGVSKAAQIGSQVENVIRTQSCPILIAQENFKEPQTVMIAYDGSETSQRALQLVLRTPLLEGRPCHLVKVGNDDDGKLKEANKMLQEKGYTTHTALLSGDIEDQLWGYVDSHNIDIMVMGAYGHSRIRQFFIGSNTTKMLLSTKIPLVLIR